MTAAQYDITIEQGATFVLDLVYESAPDVPVNLSGWSARMQVRRKHADDVALLDLSTTGGEIVLGGSAGTIVVTASATDTAAIDARIGVYDLELIDTNGVVKRLMEGKVIITPEVTR